ncbi:MAG: hypothetical protein U5K31_14255 [Balneolaceae bacterium]|nr:hypothetical protein [Balneolaceae bacterium]
MYRRTLGALLIAGGLLLVGCSAPSPAIQDNPQTQPEAETSWPGWYRADTPLQTTGSGGWTLHAAALGADSARAASAALQHARKNLSSQLSEQLEQVRRSVASTEAAKDTGVAESSFVMALRKAERELGALAERERTEAQLSDEASSWRAFVEVRMDKQVLTRHLEQALSSHATAWQALRGSDGYRLWGAGG